ncbi:DoxX family protein [Microlunatus speluncae]|uniref:DoxX family protein n=1 Tax=Microlunatus speluncae TaxID=2594267 RepID=UPI00137607CE|nr:DoxX family protein [Microlunatus speluncae]
MNYTSYSPSKNDSSARRRAGNVVLWILQVIAALGFLLAALGKLTGDPVSVATFDSLGWGPPLRYLLAGLELLGSVALFIPRLTGPAATAFVALTIGAIAVQLGTGGSVAMAVALLIISAIVAWGRRRSTIALIAAVRERRPARRGD